MDFGGLEEVEGLHAAEGQDFNLGDFDNGRGTHLDASKVRIWWQEWRSPRGAGASWLWEVQDRAGLIAFLDDADDPDQSCAEYQHSRWFGDGGGVKCESEIVYTNDRRVSAAHIAPY